MNKKQYAIAQDIIICSKYFAEEINKILEDSGLAEEGYRLVIKASDLFDSQYTNKTYDCFVELELRDPNVKDRFRKSFRRWHDKNGEWENRADGIIDSSESEDAPKKAVPSRAEKAAKPYPPDGLWIGLDYADPHVDGGM